MAALQHRVLIVDDEHVIRTNLMVFLEDEGMVVYPAATAEEALSILTREPFLDAAIVDIRLPGMNGIAFIDQASQHHPELVYIIYTGSVDPALYPELQEFGILPGQVFKKPVKDMSILVQAVQELIRKKGDFRNERGIADHHSDH